MGSSQDSKGSFPLQSPGQGWALQCLGQLSAPEHVQRQEDRRDRGPDHSLCGDESEKLTRGKQQPNSSRTEGSPAGRTFCFKTGTVLVTLGGVHAGFFNSQRTTGCKRKKLDSLQLGWGQQSRNQAPGRPFLYPMEGQPLLLSWPQASAPNACLHGQRFCGS